MAVTKIEKLNRFEYVRFGSLGFGETVLDGKTLCMVIPGLDGKDQMAINLQNGKIVPIHPDSDVIPVRVEIYYSEISMGV